MVEAAAPRSELETILRRVAPAAPGREPEVMIAISNYNLILGGQLNTWLEVCVEMVYMCTMSFWKVLTQRQFADDLW